MAIVFSTPFRKAIVNFTPRAMPLLRNSVENMKHGFDVTARYGRSVLKKALLFIPGLNLLYLASLMIIQRTYRMVMYPLLAFKLPRINSDYEFMSTGLSSLILTKTMWTVYLHAGSIEWASRMLSARLLGIT